MNREIYTLYMIANIGPNLSTKEWVDNNDLFLQLATKVVKEVNDVFLYNFSEVLNRIYLLNHSNIDVLEEFANKIQDDALKEDVKKLKQWISLYKEKQPHFTIKDLETVFRKVGFRFNYDLKGVYQLYHKYINNEDDDKQLIRAILYPFVFIKQYQIALELIISLNMVFQDWVNGENAKFVLPMLVGYLDRLYTVFKSIPKFWSDNRFKSLFNSWQIATNSSSKKIMFQYLLPEFREFIKEHALKKKRNSYIESYQNVNELKGKKLDDKTIFSMLVNLYAGITMLQRWKLEEEDKKTLQFILFHDYVTPIIQSVFYDTIKHYQEEISEFKEALIYYYTILGALSKLLKPDFFEKLQEKNVLPNDIERLKKSLTHILHYFVSGPCYKLLKKLDASIPKKLQSDSISFTIDEWIRLIKQIPSDVWKNFSKCTKKVTDDPIMGALADALIDINYYLKDFDVFKVVDINAFIFPFLYFDEPYYSAFYNSLLPLYQQYNICKTHLTFDNLQKLIVMLDHIKDLQHHSNFFWISISKRTMDFISNSKTLKDLIPNVTDPDILRIYRKYKYVYNENLFNKSHYIQLLEGLKGEQIYPKKANSEQLKHYLANMYLGEYLLHNVVKNDKEKKIIAFETYYSGVLPVIQSIFYDTIDHYKEEAIGLLLNYDRVQNFQSELEDIFLQIISKLKEKGIEKEIIEDISRHMNEALDRLKNFPCFNNLHNLLGALFVNYKDHYYNAKPNISITDSIESWISIMKQIDRHKWKEFSTTCKNKIYSLLDKIDLIFSLAEEFGLRDYRDDIDILSPFEVFFFFDTPYYQAFYNNILPLYETFEKYRQSFAPNLLNDLILQIDHIKDLRHHNDFFWISLKKEDMDFIKNAKVKELYQVATSSTLKKIYKQYRGIIQKEGLDLLSWNKIFIESLQINELKPQKATNEQLEGYLANLYMGLLLLYENIDNYDKQIIQEAVWNSGVLPIVQSIYYDTIGHYLQEMRDFVARVKIYEDAVIYVNDVIEKLISDLEKYGVELVNDPTLTSAAIDDYWDFVDGLRGTLYADAAALEEEEVENMYHLSEYIADCLEDLAALQNKMIGIENIPIRKWIECMLSIPRDVWKQYVKDVDTIEEAVHSIFSIFDYAQRYQIYPYLENIDFGWPFQYMDAPYYNAFYNVFLPFWKLIESYQESPRLQLLKQIAQAIDHIKDLQHHSDFFWTSLQKDTMDFISHAKISELIQYVTDSDIRNIYKKYRFIFRER